MSSRILHHIPGTGNGYSFLTRLLRQSGLLQVRHCPWLVCGRSAEISGSQATIWLKGSSNKRSAAEPVKLLQRSGRLVQDRVAPVVLARSFGDSDVCLVLELAFYGLFCAVAFKRPIFTMTYSRTIATHSVLVLTFVYSESPTNYGR